MFIPEWEQWQRIVSPRSCRLANTQEIKQVQPALAQGTHCGTGCHQDPLLEGMAQQQGHTGLQATTLHTRAMCLLELTVYPRTML